MELETLQLCIERQKAEFESLFPQLKSSKSVGPRLSLEKVGHDETITPSYSRTTRKVVEFLKVSSFEDRKLQSITSKATTVFRSFDGAHLVKLEQISTFNLNDDEYQDTEESIQRNNPPGSILKKLDYAPDQEHTDQLTESSIILSTSEAVLLRLDSIRVGTVEEIKSKTKLDKAWLSAKELVETEKKYVGKLRLIHERVSTYGYYCNDCSKCLLMQSDRVIADVMLKYSPYLKMYSIYVNNFTPAMTLYEELKVRNKLFDKAVLEIQQMPECENLPFDAHMICPVQRVPRYQLLLQQYLDNLPDDHIDRPNTEIALEKVKGSANHANEFMKKLRFLICMQKFGATR
uniref:DH domain-containing protein n=1 Tax=Romanomermis culicivorax TaxID=13658 RepID=A0A915I375_ROMCU